MIYEVTTKTVRGKSMYTKCLSCNKQTNNRGQYKQTHLSSLILKKAELMNITLRCVKKQLNTEKQNVHGKLGCYHTFHFIAVLFVAFLIKTKQ